MPIVYTIVKNVGMLLASPYTSTYAVYAMTLYDVVVLTKNLTQPSFFIASIKINLS